MDFALLPRSDVGLMLLAVLALVNLWVLAAFGLNRLAGRKGLQGTSETALLTMAFFGGSPGAKMGQVVFGENRPSPDFGARLNQIILLHILMLLVFGIPTVRNIVFHEAQDLYFLLKTFI